MVLWPIKSYEDGLAQNCSNNLANTLVQLQFYAKPPMYSIQPDVVQNHWYPRKLYPVNNI